jgi:hypothetical protein
VKVAGQQGQWAATGSVVLETEAHDHLVFPTKQIASTVSGQQKQDQCMLRRKAQYRKKNQSSAALTRPNKLPTHPRQKRTALGSMLLQKRSILELRAKTGVDATVFSELRAEDMAVEGRACAQAEALSDPCSRAALEWVTRPLDEAAGSENQGRPNP